MGHCDYKFVSGKKKGTECNRFIRKKGETKFYQHKKAIEIVSEQNTQEKGETKCYQHKKVQNKFQNKSGNELSECVVSCEPSSESSSVGESKPVKITKIHFLKCDSFNSSSSDFSISSRSSDFSISSD